MSHFIQDNQQIVITNDGYIMLFLKGGDNNVTSHSGKRLSSWFFQQAFTDKEMYDNAIEIYCGSDISGGSWQFASLKNKSFSGYLEYYSVVFNRFENAFKKALKIDWNLKDVNIENIRTFNKDVKNLFQTNGISLNDESGDDYNAPGILPRYTNNPEDEALAKIQKNINFPNERFMKTKTGFRDLCIELKDLTKKDFLLNHEACSRYAKTEISWSNGLTLLESLKIEPFVNDISYETFKTLMFGVNSAKTLLSTWSLKHVQKVFPEYFGRLISDTTFDCLLKNIILENSKEEYPSTKKYLENYTMFKYCNYKLLIAEKESLIREIKKSAKEKFIEAWEKIIPSCWYKQTDTMIPKLINEIDELISYNTFDIQECFEDKDLDLSRDFYKLGSYSRDQLKKNQKFVKLMAEYLAKKFSSYLNERTVMLFQNYFGLSIQKGVTNTTKKEQVTYKTQSLFA